MVFIERRAKRLIKQVSWASGIFFSFLGLFFAISPHTSIHDPEHALIADRVHLDVPVAHAEAIVVDVSTGGDDDDCGGDAGGSGDADDG